MGLLDDLRAELIAKGGVARLFEARGLTLAHALDGLAAELAASAPWKVRQQARRDLLGYLGAVAQAPEEGGGAGGPGFDAVLVAYWQARDQAPPSLPEPTARHVIDLPTYHAITQARLTAPRSKARQGAQAAGQPRQGSPSPPGGSPLRPPAEEEQVPESRSIPSPQPGLGGLAGDEEE